MEHDPLSVADYDDVTDRYRCEYGGCGKPAEWRIPPSIRYSFPGYACHGHVRAMDTGGAEPTEDSEMSEMKSGTPVIWTAEKGFKPGTIDVPAQFNGFTGGGVFALITLGNGNTRRVKATSIRPAKAKGTEWNPPENSVD